MNPVRRVGGVVVGETFNVVVVVMVGGEDGEQKVPMNNRYVAM